MSVHARRARLLGAAGVVLLMAAAAALVIGLRAQQHAHRPPASAASPAQVLPAPGPAGAPAHATSRTGSSGSTRGPLLSRSHPVRLELPAIHVSSRIQQLGLARDGSVQVPPLGRDSHAGWYRNSPTPGQLGPSILLGHIDTAKYGPGVFFRLGDLRQRDKVLVTRADHTVAVFEIERVVEYRKTRFPTLQVYGNLDHAGLRLITCGGRFNPASHSYEDNIVAYASLVSSHPQTVST